MSGTQVETAAATTQAAETTETGAVQVQAAVQQAEQKAASEQKQEQTTTQDAQQQKPVVPEKYELKLPEGSQLKQADVDKIALVAKEKGLSNDQAQLLLEQKSQGVAEFQKQQLEAFEQQKQGWFDQCSQDPEIGGEKFKENAELAMRAFEKWAPPEFFKIMNSTGLGNHPGFVKTFVKIGKAMGEDKMVFSGAQSNTPEKTAAQVLFPNTPSN